MGSVRLGLLIAELSSAGTGINAAVRGIVRTDAGDVEAYVKRLSDPRELLVETVCAVLGRQLKLPVPEPLLVLIPAHLGGPLIAFGSAAVDQPNLNTWVRPQGNAQVQERLRAWPDLIRAACFDEWIANCDRHDGNVLFDGISKFWLIDHGLALNPVVHAWDLAPLNQLFEFATTGQPEASLLSLKPKTLGVMQGYTGELPSEADGHLPHGMWPDSMRIALLDWLGERQNHLMRLGAARIPTRQGAFPL